MSGSGVIVHDFSVLSFTGDVTVIVTSISSSGFPIYLRLSSVNIINLEA
jgi:hypothetical protein